MAEDNIFAQFGPPQRKPEPENIFSRFGPSPVTAEQPETVKPYSEKDVEVSGAPAGLRTALGGLNAEDRFRELKKLDPNAVMQGDDNFIYRDPETGKVTLWNEEGWLPTWGDIGSIYPDIAEVAGGALAAGAAAPAAVASAIPTGGASLLTLPAAYGLGAAGGREAATLAGNYLAGVDDTRGVGQRFADTGQTALTNAVFEMAGPAAREVGSKAWQGVKSLLPGNLKQAGEVAAKRIAEESGRTLESVRSDLTEHLQKPGVLPIGTGAALDAPSISAAERNFRRLDPNVWDEYRRGAEENLTAIKSLFAPEGTTGALRSTAQGIGDDVTRFLDEATAVREEAMDSAYRQGGERVAQTAEEVAKRNADAAAEAARIRAEAAETIARQQADLAGRQGAEVAGARGAIDTALTTGSRAADAASTLSGELLGERGLRRKVTEGLYSLPDKDIAVSAAPLDRVVKELADEMNTVIGVPNPGSMYPVDFMKAWAKNGLTTGKNTVEVLDKARSALGDAIRSAYTSGNNVLGRNLNRLKDAINESFEEIPGVKDQFAQARAYTATKLKAPYLEGVSKSVFEPANRGGFKVAPERVLNYFIKPDLAGGVSAARQLLDVLPVDEMADGTKRYSETAIKAIQDFVIDNLRGAVTPASGKIDEAKLTKWISDHQGALKTIPGLSERVSSVQRAVQAFGETTTRHAEEIRALNAGAQTTRNFAEEEAKRVVAEAAGAGKAELEDAKRWAKELLDIAKDKSLVNEAKRNVDAYAKSALSNVLKVEPETWARSMLNAGGWRNAWRDVSSRLAGHPQALDGARRAIFDEAWERLHGKLTSGGQEAFDRMLADLGPKLKVMLGPETARHFDDVARAVADTRKSFVGPTKSFPASLSGEDPRTAVMKWIRRGGGTMTARAITAILKGMPALGAVVGGTPGYFAGTAGAAVGVRYEQFTNAFAHQVNDFYKEAVLDPKIARSLVDQVLTRQNAPSKYRDFLRAYNRALLPGSFPEDYNVYGETVRKMLTPGLLRRGIAASETE